MMNAGSGENFQNKFIKLALRSLPHHIALHIAVKLHNEWLTSKLNSYAESHFVRLHELMHFDKSELRKYKKVTHDSVLWHGTGRYQHDKGKVVDVLNAILESGSLRPAEDAYAIFSGGELMSSISLTRLRIIGRSYADIFADGFRENNRYGDALMWISYHYGLFYARLYGLHYPTLKKYYKKWHSLTHDENGHNTWGKKANKNAQDVWDIFGLGSDIPGNYPIIFGIKDIPDTLPLNSVFDKYEVRVGRNILLNEINHVEVPLSKVGHVKSLLAQYNSEIPVLPIELGEFAASCEQFSKLMGIPTKHL